jgi:uncharacterized delta-60 repeat protein
MRLHPSHLTQTLLPFVLAPLISSGIHAAPDTVDTAFAGTAGQVYRNSPNDFGSVASILVQPDGKILVGSNEMATNLGPPEGRLQVPLLRFNPDGTVDETFFADADAQGEVRGIVFQGQGWPEVMALGRQSDGKIIAAGVMTGMNDDTNEHESRNIVRIGTDGRVDTSFQTAGTQQWVSFNINYINHLIVEPDDKVVIAGGFRGVRDSTLLPFTTRHGIARLNANGSLDTTFAMDLTQFGVDPAFLGAARVIIYQAERDASGNYYVVGEIGGTGPDIQIFARLFPDGNRDFSFSPSLPEARWNSVALDRQGRITVTGLVDFNPTVAYRVFPDGSVDPSFTAPATWFGASAQPLEIDSAGRFLFRNGAQLGRVLENGSIDATFNATSQWINWATTPSFNLATTAADGTIYAGGFFDRVNGVDAVKFVRFDGDSVPGQFLLDHPSIFALESAGTFFVGVTRVGDGSGAASLDFATANGTAAAGVDFTSATNTLTWAAGETGTKFAAVSLTNDALADGDKAFTVVFTNATGAPITGPTVTNVTILDDEAAPSFVAHPQGGSVNAGNAYTFSAKVDVRGAATLQWQRDTGTGFENIPGATALTFRLAGAVLPDAGPYRLVVTTATGTVTSNPATLVVETPPGSVLPLSIANLSTLVGNVLALATDSEGRTLVMGSGGIRRLLIDGTIDPSFSTTINTSNASIVPLPGGKILIGGSFTSVNGQSRTGFARLNDDGSLDTGFTLNPGFYVRAMAVDAEGRIYLGGLSNNGLFRYSAAGVLDNTFSAPTVGVGGGFNPGAVYSINPRPDGTVLVGYRSVISGSTTNFFQRLLSSGAFDPSFTPPALAPALNGSVEQSLVLPDGRIAIVGNFNGRIAILGENGGFDSSFNPSHAPNATVSGVAYADGRLLVWGGFTQVGGVAQRGFARYFLDGLLDAALVLAGGADQTVNALLIDDDGNYLLGGSFSNFGPASRNRLALILAGPPPAVFANSRPLVLENAGSITLVVRRLGDPDGAVTIDWSTADDEALAGTDYVAASGTLSWVDGDATDKSIIVNLINNTLVQPTRTFRVVFSDPTGPIIGGAAAVVSVIDDDTPVQFTSQPQAVVVYAGAALELNATTSSPTTVTYQWFRNDDPLDGATSATYTLASASAGNAGTYFLRATNTAGFVDSQAVEVVVLPEPAAVADGFAFGPTLNGAPETIIPLPTGGALVGGFFSTVNGGSAKRYLIRVGNNGALDEGFAAVPNGNVRTALRLPDGRILVGGEFTQITGVNVPHLAMINENGTLDSSFMSNLGSGANGSVNALALTPQGRIVVGGNFTFFNNAFGTGYVVVLNADGTRDPAFTSTANAGVDAAAVQPDGKILLGGTFSYEGANRFVRLFPTGRRDNSFAGAITGSPTIRRIVVRDDGRIHLAGSFTVSSQNRSHISFASDGTGPTVEFTGSGGIGLAFLPGSAEGRIHLRNSSPGYFWLNLPEDTSSAAAFNSALNFNNSVTAMALENGGALWAGGNFTQFRSQNHHRIVRINGIPTRFAIVSQPGLTAVEPGGVLTLSVDVESLTTASYQWYRNGVALTNDSRISGATTANLTITGAAAGDEGSYTLEVIHTGGSTTSKVIPVYVADAPRIISPPDDTTILAGGTLVLEATVVGASPITHAWTRNGSPITNGGNISGATRSRLVITNTALADAGTYILTSTNSDGADDTSVSVTVLPPPADRHPTFNTLAASGIINAILPISGGRTLVATATNGVTGGLNNTSSTSRLALVGPDRNVTTPIANFTANADAITAMALGPDEKIILRGGFTSIAGSAAPGLVRLNPDFTVDPYFAPAAPPATSNALAVDSQGRVLIGGNFTSYAGSGRNYLVRLLPDGAIDPSFNHPLNGEVRVVKVLSGDRVLVCSGTSSFLPSTHQAAILAANGSLETSFPVAGVNDVDADSDGRIYVALASSPRVARYLANGTVDAMFAANLPVLNGSVNRLIVQPNGRIVLFGAFSSPYSRAVRLEPDGSQDATFQPGSGFGSTTSYSLAADAFGRLWFGGSFTSYQGSAPARLAVLNGDASELAFVTQPLASAVEQGANAAFSVEATGTSAISYQWFKGEDPLQNVGNITGATSATLNIAGAGQADVGPYSVRISNASGTLFSRAVPLDLLAAPVFTSVPAGGAYEIANTRVLAPVVRGVAPITYQWLRNGEALSNNSVYSGVSTGILTITNPREADGGLFELVATNALGTAGEEISVTFFRNPARINPDVPALASLNNNPRDMLFLPNGERLLGGNFSSVNSSTVRGLAFIQPNGSVRTTSVQVYQTSSSGSVATLATDSQGRIYAGGGFTSSTQGTTGAVSVGRLIRAVYNSDLDRWERDTTYAIGTGAGNNVVNKLAVDGNDRLLVGGTFTSFNGDTTKAYLVRLLPSGAFDPDFTPAVPSVVTQMAQLPDGRILVAGTNYFVRLLENGSVDPTFTPAQTSNINALEVFPDKRLLIARSPSPTLVLMEENGAAVSGFPNASSPTFSGSGTSAIHRLPDGNILLGGVTSYDGISTNRLLMIQPDGSLNPDFDAESGPNTTIDFIRTDGGGPIHLGGSFTTYQGATVPRYITLNGLPAALQDPAAIFAAFLESAGVPEGLRGADDDGDLDGIPNLVEWLYDLSPVASNAGLELFSTLVPGDGAGLNALAGGNTFDPAESYFTFSVLLPDDTKGATLTVQAAADLGDFDGTPLAIIPVGAAVAEGPGFSRQTYAFASPVRDAPLGFVRIKTSF